MHKLILLNPDASGGGALPSAPPARNMSMMPSASSGSIPEPSSIDMTPSQPSPEQISGETLSLESFTQPQSEPVTVEAKPPAQQQQQDKPATTPREQVQQARDKQIASVAQTKPNEQQPQVDTTGRDYTWAKDENERQVLRQMPNKVFDYMKTELPRLRQVEAQLQTANQELDNVKNNRLPASYYQHPEAYVLSPDYAAASNELNYIQFEENHWRRQLAGIRSGQKQIATVDYNEKGEPVYHSVPVTAENVAELETNVQAALMRTINEAQQQQGKKQAAQQQFVSRYTQATQYLVDNEKKLLPSYADKDKSPRSAEMRQFKQSYIPPEFREHPLSNILASAYGLIIDLNAHIAALQKGQVTQQQVASDAKRGGPTADDMGGGGGKGGVASELNMTEFDS